MEFSRIDRNNRPLSGQKDGQINDRISELELVVLELLRDNPRLTNAELIEKTGKSQRTTRKLKISGFSAVDYIKKTPLARALYIIYH